MGPTVALGVWLILLLALLWFDPAKESGVSAALWVPVVWMFILATRLPSIWLDYREGALTMGQALQDGNLLDRIISLVLLFLAVGVLVSRSFKWDYFFRRNVALTAFILFGLASVFWSDFPLVAYPTAAK